MRSAIAQNQAQDKEPGKRQRICAGAIVQSLLFRLALEPPVLPDLRHALGKRPRAWSMRGVPAPTATLHPHHRPATL